MNVVGHTPPFVFPYKESVYFWCLDEFLKSFKNVSPSNILVWWEWVVDSDNAPEDLHVLQLGFYQIEIPNIVRVRVKVSPADSDRVIKYLTEAWQVVKNLWGPISANYTDSMVMESIADLKATYERSNPKPIKESRIERFLLRNQQK